jgi:hypothetical protein
MPRSAGEFYPGSPDGPSGGEKMPSRHHLGHAGAKRRHAKERQVFGKLSLWEFSSHCVHSLEAQVPQGGEAFQAARQGPGAISADLVLTATRGGDQSGLGHLWLNGERASGTCAAERAM